MVDIPVWVDSWALSCCLGVIARGQTREVTLVAYEIEDLERTADGSAMWEAEPDGTIRFTARVLSSSGGGPGDVALLDLGDLLVAARGIEGDAPLSGRTRVWNEPHWSFDNEVGDKATIKADVVRLRRAPELCTMKGTTRYVTGYGDPVEVDITDIEELDSAYVIDLDRSSPS